MDLPLQPILYNPGTHAHLIPHFASLHATCIIQDHTIVNFIPPLAPSRIESWWQARALEVTNGSRDILFLLSSNSHASSQSKDGVVAGVVMLNKPEAETGPFRGLVEKLLVAPGCRRQGVARCLMAALENVARRGGRTLLMLDTETGSPAEGMYPQLGYTKIGVIPKYSISPKDGSLKSETFFYKDLRSS
ncbi:MAG: hypothetical protein Q9223_004732 [Gallowayella weberi]